MPVVSAVEQPRLALTALPSKSDTLDSSSMAGRTLGKMVPRHANSRARVLVFFGLSWWFVEWEMDFRLP